MISMAVSADSGPRAGCGAVWASSWGLSRRNKARFHPVWEASYLVARGGVALPWVLVDVSALIAGGLRELIA